MCGWIGTAPDTKMVDEYPENPRKTNAKYEFGADSSIWGCTWFDKAGKQHSYDKYAKRQEFFGFYFGNKQGKQVDPAASKFRPIPPKKA